MVFIMINGNMPPKVIFVMLVAQTAPLLLNGTSFAFRQEYFLLVLGLSLLAYEVYKHRAIVQERGIGGFITHLMDSLRDNGSNQDEPMNQANNEQYSKMLKTISRLPTEEFKTPSDCTIHEVKERLDRRGLEHKKCIEKEELVKLLNEFRGGPTASCCICCEDYVEGDVLRILSKCKHDFHLECLDKWALTLANSTRTPSCPLCNQDL